MVVSPSPAPANFHRDLRRGQHWERALDNHFARWFAIEPVSMALQRLGIDRVWTALLALATTYPATGTVTTGQRFTVEYKGDERLAFTGNVFWEEGDHDRPGWAFTSVAQLIVYLDTQNLEAHVLDTVRLRLAARQWQHYPTRTVRNQHQTQQGTATYSTQGRLIPAPIVWQAARVASSRLLPQP